MTMNFDPLPLSKIEQEREQLHAERDCFMRPLPAPVSVWVVGAGSTALTFPTRKAAVNYVCGKYNGALRLWWGLNGLDKAFFVTLGRVLPPIRRIEIPARKRGQR